jgi:hypothetical protein
VALNRQISTAYTVNENVSITLPSLRSSDISSSSRILSFYASLMAKTHSSKSLSCSEVSQVAVQRLNTLLEHCRIFLVKEGSTIFWDVYLSGQPCISERPISSILL